MGRWHQPMSGESEQGRRTAAALLAAAMNGEKLVTNAEFLRFAAHYGFKVRACRPYRAQTKGKVERPIFYVRDNFIYGREFLNDANLDAQGSWRTPAASLTSWTRGWTSWRPRTRGRHPSSTDRTSGSPS